MMTSLKVEDCNCTEMVAESVENEVMVDNG